MAEKIKRLFSTHTIETASIHFSFLHLAVFTTILLLSHSFSIFLRLCRALNSTSIRFNSIRLYLLLIFHSLTTAYFLFFICQLSFRSCSSIYKCVYVAAWRFLVTGYFTFHSLPSNAAFFRSFFQQPRNLFNFEQCEKSSSHCEIRFSMHYFHLFLSLSAIIVCILWKIQQWRMWIASRTRFDSLVGFKLILLMTVSRTTFQWKKGWSKTTKM